MSIRGHEVYFFPGSQYPTRFYRLLFVPCFRLAGGQGYFRGSRFPAFIFPPVIQCS